jgi:cyclase
MSHSNRFIPVLQIDRRRLVKTVQFKSARYLGDPLNAIRVFNLKGVSELVITDIHATQTKVIDFEFLKKLSSQAFVPLSYGGGVSSIDDVHKLYDVGFDRILFGTSAIQNPALITETARIYGSQSVICSLDIRGDKITCQGNKKRVCGLDIPTVIKKFVDAGAGEILLHDVERDGTYLGLNYDLIRSISKLSSIPVIANGGAKSMEDMRQAIAAGASAVAAGSLFSFYGKHRAVLINYGV